MASNKNRTDHIEEIPIEKIPIEENTTLKKYVFEKCKLKSTSIPHKLYFPHQFLIHSKTWWGLFYGMERNGIMD